ncbi:Small-conductance mechanosensitive channel [Albimonas donghaensis]|uniref:Small-conductance mechanosensitive channel n=2 Tax=Albimonas donghaensis TaxID=356660 RepID=A0A1H3CAG2_9RHOB|nr:Small-conductance mechanosensitive channel [Albimonas donghaensis]
MMRNAPEISRTFRRSEAAAQSRRAGASRMAGWVRALALVALAAILCAAPWPSSDRDRDRDRGAAHGWGGAQAQVIDYGRLFGAPAGKSEEDAPAPQMSRPATEPGAVTRPPDLATYGLIADAARAQEQPSMLRRSTRNVSVFRQRLERMLSEARDGLTRMGTRLDAASPDGHRGYFAGVALVTAILILIGRAVTGLYGIYLARPLMITAQRRFRTNDLSGKIPVLALRFAMTLVAVLIITAISLGLGIFLFEEHAPTQATAGLIVLCYVTFIAADTAWRMTLSPYLPEYRVPRMSDADARRLYLWLSGLTAFGVTSGGYTYWLNEMGVGTELVRLNAIVLGFVSFVAAVTLVWVNRAAVSGAILRGRSPYESTWISALGAKIWAPLITVYLLAAWVEEALRNVMGLDKVVPLLAGAFLTLLLALLSQAAGLYAVEQLFHRSRTARRMQEEADAARAADAARVSPGGDGAPPLDGQPPASGDAATAPGDGLEDGHRTHPRVEIPPLDARSDPTSDAPADPGADAGPAAAGPDPLRRAEPAPGPAPDGPAPDGPAPDGSAPDGPARDGAVPAAGRMDVGDMDGDGDDEGGGPVSVPPRPGAERPPAPAPEPASRTYRPTRTMRSFEDLARRVVSLFSLGAGAYALIRVWGGSGIFADGSFFDRSQDVIDTLFLGYIAYHAMRIWLDQRIEAEGGDDIVGEPGDEGGGASAASRLGTLLPLFRSAILVTIGISVAVIVATELGVNVAPLFAGAGIVGIAVGFGAQTLVRDILSGMFFLLDDAFRKGEYIDVGSVKGTVEKISLRSFQLRHHLGALHTIPFGEIAHLTNFSRDWVMMKLPLRLTYDTDVDKVRKLVKKLGERLKEHPIEGPKFVQPLKSQGVYMMEDSAMIIRIKYMTRPGDQWTTRKLVYQEIRELFEKEGIHFAHREVTVRIPNMPDRPLNHDEKAAVGAAARRAVEDEKPGADHASAMAAAEAR